MARDGNAVKAAARAAFDYATQSDEYSDRFELWWATYSQEDGALVAREAEELVEYVTTRDWKPDFSAGQSFEEAMRVAIADGTLVMRDTEREHEPASECEKPDRWSGLPCVRELGHQPPCQAHARFVAYPDDRVTGKHATEVLAKALDEFAREAVHHAVLWQVIEVQALMRATAPTLRALGYGKGETT